MAKTALMVQGISRDGLAPVFGTANADGHYFLNDGRTYLEVKNGGGSAVTVTLVAQARIDGVAPANGGKQVTLPAGGGLKIGPFPADVYNKADGTVEVTFSAVADLTLGAFRVG